MAALDFPTAAVAGEVGGAKLALKFSGRATDAATEMDPVVAAKFDAMAAHTSNAAQMMVLRKALDSQTESVMQLLTDGLPQKDNAGQIVDVQA